MEKSGGREFYASFIKFNVSAAGEEQKCDIKLVI